MQDFSYQSIRDLDIERTATAEAFMKAAANHQGKYENYRKQVKAIEDDGRLAADYKRQQVDELRSAWIDERKKDAKELVSYAHLLRAFEDAPVDLDRLSRAVGIIAAAGPGCPASVLSQLAEAAKGSPAELRAMHAAARSSMGDNAARASAAFGRYMVDASLYDEVERIITGSAKDGTDSALLGTGEGAICDMLAREAIAADGEGMATTPQQVANMQHD